MPQITPNYDINYCKHSIEVVLQEYSRIHCKACVRRTVLYDYGVPYEVRYQTTMYGTSVYVRCRAR